MSPLIHQILLFTHLAGVIVWVGGMFFAYFCLRPAAGAILKPPERLPLWTATFRLFLAYSAVAVVLILASGVIMLTSFGLSQAPAGWHAMLALGLVMAAVFSIVYFVLFPRLAAHCAASSWPAAANVLNNIRRLVALNLLLALCTIVAAVLAR
ncbi:MAG TPA: CopD family protein [Methylotenera sp.]|jgi:uncharacterized membrane protein